MPQPATTPAPATGRHPVIDLILARAASNSKPGARRDNACLALAFEGGGMRGITSAGMGLALVQLGLTDVFDVVYGSSAGAFNSAYFVSRQGAFGITMYYENINNSRFISLRRLLFGRPVVDLDYMFSVAMNGSKPLDYEAIARSKIGLRIVAANITRRQVEVFDRFDSKDDLILKLRASAAMPFLTGPPVRIHDEFYSDASLYEAIPFRSAREQCTHLLVLRSRPAGAMRQSPSFLDRRVLGGSLAKHHPDLYSDYLKLPQQYANDLEALDAHTLDHSLTPFVRVVTVPAGVAPVSSLERRRDVLVQSAAAGMKAMVAALSDAEIDVMELIAPLRRDGRPFTL